jgi:hypothetical protein
MERRQCDIRIFSKGYRYTFAVVCPAKLYLRGIIDFVLATDPSARTVAILGENEPFSKEVGLVRQPRRRSSPRLRSRARRHGFTSSP